MNQEEIKEIKEKISPGLRKRIEGFNKLSVEEKYVLHERDKYFSFISAVIAIFFVFQLPFKVLYTSLSTFHYTPEFASLMFVVTLWYQALLLFAIVFICFIYIFFIDYITNKYFIKSRSIFRKLRGEDESAKSK